MSICTMLMLMAIAAEESTPRLVPKEDAAIEVNEAADIVSEGDSGVPRLISSEDAPPTLEADPSAADVSLAQRLITGVELRDESYYSALKEFISSLETVKEFVGIALGEEVAQGRRAYRVIQDAVFAANTPELGAALAEMLLGQLPPPQAQAPAPVEKPSAPATLWDAIHALARAAAEEREATAPISAESQYHEAFQLQVQRDLLRWVGLLAGPEKAGAIAAYVPDPDLGTAAVDALACIPGAGVDAVLCAALPTADPAVRVQIAGVLGKRGDRSAIGPLTGLARTGGSRELTWAALEALAELGEPPSVALKPDPGFTREEGARYAGLGLRAAQQLEYRGDGRSAERIYLSFMNLYSRRSHLRAALLGLGRVDSPSLFQQAMGFMTTPGVRESAIEALATARVTSIEDQLASAFYVTDPSTRAGILQTLHRRGSSHVASLLTPSLLSDSLELRVAAADIAGTPVSDVDLLRLAREGNPWIRLEALRRYLSRAEEKIASGALSAARDPLLQVAQGPFSTSERIRAIDALSAYPDEEVAAILQSLAKDPAVGEAAYRVHVEILSATAAGGGTLEALESVAAGADTLETVSIAARAIEAQGQPASELAEQWGFISNWKTAGPFPDYAQSYLPESSVRPPASVRFEDTVIEWTPVTTQGLPAVLELPGQTGEAWYAWAAVALPEWVTGELRMGSNAACAVWLNGEAIHRVEDARVLEADDDFVQIALQPGLNHLLIKLAIPGGAARVTARLTGRDGKAFDLTAQQMPDDGATGVGTRPTSLSETISEDAP